MAEASREIVIGLGANLSGPAGPPEASLEEALTQLEARGARVSRFSGWWRSRAYPPGSGPDFVNAAAMLETALEPEALRAALHAVEAALGRVRRERWAPRVVDLDLLCYGQKIAPDPATLRRWINLGANAQAAGAPDALILPHPRLQERAFALGPMVAVAAAWRHPLLESTAAALLAALPDAARAEAWPAADLPPPAFLRDRAAP